MSKAILAVGGLVAGVLSSIGCVGAAGEAASPEPTASPESPDDPAEVARAERTGEAQDPWTRAECQQAFVDNLHKCDSWPEHKALCQQMCAALLVACIKLSRE
jgi:hypothetical protein